MRFLLGCAALFAGCVERSPEPFSVDAAAPPADLLSTPLSAGQRFVVEVRGVLPGSSVTLVRGSAFGSGPCPPVLAGDCLDLLSPTVMSEQVADAGGVARFPARVPATAPAGARLVVQAVQRGVGVLSGARTFEVDVDPLLPLGDDFEDPASLGSWTVLSELEGSTPLHDRIEVDGVVPGALVIDANSHDDLSLPDGGTGPAWFEDRKGPLVFREVEGDFAARVEVQVGTTADLEAIPVGHYLAGGLLMRAPSEVGPGVLGQEGWMMFNVGQQQAGLAVELKTTFPDLDGDGGSDSTLFLEPVDSAHAELIACRRGSVFRFWSRLAGETGWYEEQPRDAILVFNGAWLTGPDYLATGFVRPDLPARLQIGVMANRYQDGGGPPVRVAAHRFDLWTPADWASCTLPPVGG
jgi:hypothetical protein